MFRFFSIRIFWIQAHLTQASCIRAISVHALLSLMLLSTSAGAQNHNSMDSKRIISAGGSITEIVHALGLLDRLVAVDTSSLYPNEVSSLPKVGYFRSLGAEGLMSLNPDLIVAARGAGPPEVLDQIGNLGVEIKLFEQSIYTLDSWQQLIHEMGAYFEREEQASKLVQEVRDSLDKVAEHRQYTSGKLNAISLMSLGQRGPVAAGKNTVPDLLMNLAGVNNLAADLEGFKPFSTELLARQKLDLILVPSHVVGNMGGKDAICGNQAIAMATAESGCNVHIMDGLLLLGFGSRLHLAVEEVMGQANQVSQ